MRRLIFVVAFLATVGLALWANDVYGYAAPPEAAHEQPAVPATYISVVELYVNDQWAGVIFTDSNGRPYYFPVHKITNELHAIGGQLIQEGRSGQFRQHLPKCWEE